MRRLAFAFAFVWLIAAFCVRLIDMRRPGLYISALTGGQQGEQVTIAWLQGDLHRDARHAFKKRRLENLIDQTVSANPGQTPDQALDLRRVADLGIECGVAG